MSRKHLVRGMHAGVCLIALLARAVAGTSAFAREPLDGVAEDPTRWLRVPRSSPAATGPEVPDVAIAGLEGASAPGQGRFDSPAVSQDNPSRAASIFGTDDRRRVTNTSTFPWSAVGLVRLNYGPQAYTGTGVMIGRRLALTCAHVAHDPAPGRPDSIDFIPGRNGASEPFGRVRVVQVLPAPQWVEWRDDGYDIAILVLAEPVGDSTGYFRIAVQPDSFFEERALEAAGYPTDLGGTVQYTVSATSIGMQGNVILHYLDTEPGQSGSPVWYGDASKGQERLVGLMEGSYLSNTPFGVVERGIAARIDQSVANWIDEQLVAHDDTPQGISGPVDANADRPFSARLCGLGIAPFLVLSFLGWTACFISRRTRR